MNSENDDIDFSKMSKEELDEMTLKIVAWQFSFARTIARVFSGGQENKEFKKFIVEESIKETEKFLEKKCSLLWQIVFLKGEKINVG